MKSKTEEIWIKSNELLCSSESLLQSTKELQEEMNDTISRMLLQHDTTFWASIKAAKDELKPKKKYLKETKMVVLPN